MGTNHGLGPMACVRCTWLAVHGAQHFPQRREAAFQAVPMWMSMHHGGARTCGNIVLLGEGSCLSPNSVAVTCNRPVLQHGHCDTSNLRARAMKAWADSTAWELIAGICKARRAASSFTALQAEASTP